LIVGKYEWLIGSEFERNIPRSFIYLRRGAKISEDFVNSHETRAAFREQLADSRGSSGKAKGL
jgi:hypothetical protein